MGNLDLRTLLLYNGSVRVNGWISCRSVVRGQASNVELTMMNVSGHRATTCSQNNVVIVTCDATLQLLSLITG
jgi:hypothetical protein